MTGGHGIVNEGRRGRKRTGVPEWTRDETKIQEILLRAFPKLMTDEKQRARAGRWARIIDAYYREGATASDIASDLGITRLLVERTLNRIRKHVAGERGKRPRGRPKKMGYAIPPPMEGQS